MQEQVFVKIHLSEENNRLNKQALEIARKDREAKALKISGQGEKDADFLLHAGR